jgi:peptide/nickel transport system substrate-binding protein
VDLLGGDITPAIQARIFSSPSLKAQADDPFIGALEYAYLNTKVAPLNNVHCRMAIEYAANRVTLQAAYGGPYVAGAIASTVSPPDIVGHKNFDLYEATAKPQGDLVKAKEQLKLSNPGLAGSSRGRSDRPAQGRAATLPASCSAPQRRHHRPLRASH